MPREMDEAYIWAAEQGGGGRLIPEASPWPEGEGVMLDEIVADLLVRIENLEQKGGGKK